MLAAQIIGLSGFLMAGVMGWWDLPIPFSFELTVPVLTDSANSPFSRLDMTMVVTKPALYLSFVLNCLKKGLFHIRTSPF